MINELNALVCNSQDLKRTSADKTLPDISTEDLNVDQNLIYSASLIVFRDLTRLKVLKDRDGRLDGRLWVVMS